MGVREERADHTNLFPRSFTESGFTKHQKSRFSCFVVSRKQKPSEALPKQDAELLGNAQERRSFIGNKKNTRGALKMRRRAFARLLLVNLGFLGFSQKLFFSTILKGIQGV